MCVCVCICVSYNACHTILNEWQQLGHLKMVIRNVPVRKAAALHDTSMSHKHISPGSFLLLNVCHKVSDGIPSLVWLITVNASCLLCCRTKTLSLSGVSIADRGCVQRLGEVNLTCRLTYRCLPHSPLFVIRTQRENQRNLRYMLSLLLKKKKALMRKKKEPELNCLTVQFFLLVLGNLSSHSDLLPGMGKTCRRQDFFSPLITHLHKHCLAHT